MGGQSSLAEGLFSGWVGKTKKNIIIFITALKFQNLL